MENLRKKLSILLLGLLLVSFASSADWDNGLRYEKNNMKVTIENWAWIPIFGNDLGTLELKSHKSVNHILKVATGKNRVPMYYDINFHELYEDGLGEVEFINMTNGETIQKDYHFVVWNLITETKNHYSTNCNEVYNSSNNSYYEHCENILIGTFEEENYGWVKLDTKNIPKGKIRIGLSTDVNMGETIDGIWTIAGKKIKKHAAWTASLNVDLISYYKLDDNLTTTNIIDSLDNNNGTLGGGDNTEDLSSIGKINLSLDCNGIDDYIGINNKFDYTEKTYSFWYYPQDAGSSSTILGNRNSGQGFDIWSNTQSGRFVTSSGTHSFGNGDPYIDNNWYHIVIVYIENDRVEFYINGTLDDNLTTLTGTLTDEFDLNIMRRPLGSPTYVDGKIDEFGIWNRPLSPSEITNNLWNNGIGNTYTTDFSTIDIVLNTPIDNFTTINPIIEFNASINATLLTITNVSLLIDGVINETNTSGITGDYIFTKTLSTGEHNWSISVVDNESSITNSETRNLTIDINPPQIIVESPTGILDYNIIGGNETLNVTFIDESLDSCWYNYNGTNVSIDGCLNATKNSTQFILEQDNLNMTIYANDTFGNLEINFTSWSYIFDTYNVSYDNTTYEGSQETFSAETSLGNATSIDQAIFQYNDTNYTTNVIFSGGTYFISSSITIPLVLEDTNFSFSFYIIVDGQTYNLETFQQEVLNINMSSCGGGDQLLLNMSLKDEESKLNISGDIEVNVQAISKTSGETIESVNLSFDDVTAGAICLEPVEAFESLYLDAEIKYVSEERVPELYYIQKADMLDYPKNLSLFDLATNDSTEFLIKYQDNDLITVEGAIVQLQRKYISEDAYEVVEAPLTSDIGTCIVHIDLNTNKYKATVVKEGEVLDVFDNLVFNCENELSGQCTENLFGKIDPQNDVPLIDLRDFSYSVSSVNNTVTTLFIIPSGTPASVNVMLTQLDQFGNETMCNQTIISSGGSLDCEFEDTIGDSFLSLSILKDDVLQADQTYLVVESSNLDFLGNNYFIGLIILLSLVGMAFSSPELMAINAVVVMLLGGALWLFNGVDFVMGLGSLIWLVVAVGILLYKMTKQEDR